MGLLPNHYKINIRFNFNEISEAEGTADHVTLLRLFLLLLFRSVVVEEAVMEVG